MESRVCLKQTCKIHFEKENINFIKKIKYFDKILLTSTTVVVVVVAVDVKCIRVYFHKF